MIAPAKDYLPFRLYNLTGRPVIVERPGYAPMPLDLKGTVVWRNESTVRGIETLCGLPIYDYRMTLFAGLPPRDPLFHPVTNPVYYLVDPFTAMALRANKIHRPDVLTMVEYTLTNDTFHVRAVGVLPPYTE